MTRAEFERALTNLQTEGTISPEERSALLEAFDAGEITAEDLPLAPREGSAGLPEWLMLAAVLDMLLGSGAAPQEERRRLAEMAARLRLEVASRGATGPLLSSHLNERSRRLLEAHSSSALGALPPATEETASGARQAGGRILGGLRFGRRSRLARDFADAFHEEAERRTSRMLFSDRYTDGLRRWQVAAREMVRDDLMGLAAMGKGAPLSAADLNRLGATWQEQQGYLQRFAEEIAAKEALGDPMSEKQVAARLKQYAGAGYSAYWREAMRDYGEGWVVRYHAVDDDGTCPPCHEAEEGSPYPATGPFPVPGNATCRGRGHCRCRLEPEENPSRYQELIQETQEA